MKKNNNKSESSLRSFTTLAIVIASSLVLASCGGGDSTGNTTTDSLSADAPTASAQAVARGTVPTGWVGRMPLPTSVEPTSNQIVKLNGISVFKDVVVVSVSPENEQQALSYVAKRGWKVLSKNVIFYQINVSDNTKLSIEEKILDIKSIKLFNNASYDNIVGINSSFTNRDPSLDDINYYNYDAIKVRPAWDLVSKEFSAKTTIRPNVGILDLGIYQEKSDLSFGIIFNKSEGCSIGKCNDHGYHVSGIIGASGNNKLQHVGIGSGSTNNQNLLASSIIGKIGLGYLYQLALNNSRVINLSIGSYSEDDIPSDKIDKTTIDKLKNNAIESSNLLKEIIDYEITKSQSGAYKMPDVLYVQAAGNLGDRLTEIIPNVTNYYDGFFNTFIEDNFSDQKYRSIIDSVIIVGAFDQNRNVANFTQRPHSEISKSRFILAPGVAIYSNTSKWPASLNDDIGSKTGTSMAAPHVSGVASLIFQVNGGLSAKEVADIILGTADSSLGTPYKDRVDGDGSNVYRYLNAEAAVKEAIRRKNLIMCGPVSAPNIVGQLGPNYTATAGQKIQFTTTPAPKTGYPFGSYNWTTSDSSATLVNNGGTLADFVLNTAGTATVTVTPVLTDGTVCTSSAATAQVNVQAVSVPAPSVSIEMSQTGLGFAGATGIGSYDYLSSLTSGIGKPAVKFNGGKFLVPNNPNMQFTDGATFDVWLRLDSMTGMDGWGNTGTNGHYAGTIIAKSHDRTGGALMVNGFGDTWVATYDPTWEKENCTRFFSASVPNGVWFRSTITLSPTTGMKGYTNKTLSWACQPSNMSFATMNSQDLYIGRFSDYWFPIPGAIADIKIYKSALTAAQISQLN